MIEVKRPPIGNAETFGLTFIDVGISITALLVLSYSRTAVSSGAMLASLLALCHRLKYK
jgi:hypothetical protein